MAPSLSLTFAVAATGLGLGALYVSWRGLPAPRRLAKALGWAVLVAAAYPWTMLAGVEFGIALAVLVPTLAAWLFVLGNFHVRRNGRAAHEQPKRVSRARPSREAILRHMGLFLVAVPLAAVCSLAVTIGVSQLLPWNQIDRNAFVLLVVPVVWGTGAAWAVMDSKPVRPAAVLGAGALIGSIAAGGT